MTELDELKSREEAVLNNISDLAGQTGLGEEGHIKDLTDAHTELREIQKRIKELGG